MIELDRVTHGDCIEVMAQLPDACVDAIVTDPPYGLEFMGKEWDKFWDKRDHRQEDNEGVPLYLRAGKSLSGYKAGMAYQSWTTAWATEAYRILKPGAYMLVMGGTRTHHRLGCGLEDAGFEIRDELAWVYASGFPKNYDVSKGIDKRAGAKRTEVIGQRHRNVKPFDDEAGWNVNYTTGDHTYKAPATPEAQYWEGYGTALKPAHEPIWLCKKPNEGTYVDNILEHGCGAMNIDGARIAVNPDVDDMLRTTERGRRQTQAWEEGSGFKNEENPFTGVRPSGRWPANVLVDCYPEEFMGGVAIEGEGKGYHGGVIKGGTSLHAWMGQPNPGAYAPQKDALLGNGLLGPYTRFFVIPKPSKSEKNKGCMELYYRKVKSGHIRIDREEWEELVAEEKRIYEETGKRVRLQARGNIHVTVKPVRLGMWLIKLIAPHQHPVIVLDPFCGSGSFLASAQQLNFDGYQIEFYGIDKDEQSVETVLARLEMERQSLPLLALASVERGT